MTRTDLQGLAKIRMKEAEALSHSGLHDGAYYLAGYAVECALKACIAKTTVRHEFPDRARVNACHTHSVTELLRLAGLTQSLAIASDADSQFDRNWKVVQSWSEQSRYARRNEFEAKRLLAAIADRKHGVLSWVKRYW
jgi:HEPN domain-containing protein